MSGFKHQENKREISNNIASLYGTEHPTEAIQKSEQQNLSPFEHRELVKSQIAGSFNENTPSLSDEELEKSAEDTLEKGGKRAVIGERRQFGGREYIKTKDGWKFHGKGSGVKATSHREGALDHHVETGKGAGEKKEESEHSKLSDADLERRKEVATNLGSAALKTGKPEDVTKLMQEVHAIETEQKKRAEKEVGKVGKPDSITLDRDHKEKPTSKHIGDMSATDMKAAADKLGIDVKGKSVKQVREALTGANIDKQLADFKAKKGDNKEPTHDPETGRELTSLERAALKAQSEGK